MKDNNTISNAMNGIAASIIGRIKPEVNPHLVASQINERFGDEYIACVDKHPSDINNYKVINLFGLTSYRQKDSKKWIWVTDEIEVLTADAEFRGLLKNIIGHLKGDDYDQDYKDFKSHMGW